MTVAQLQAEMSNAEFIRWRVFVARQHQRQQHEANKAGARSRRRRR